MALGGTGIWAFVQELAKSSAKVHYRPDNLPEQAGRNLQKNRIKRKMMLASGQGPCGPRSLVRPELMNRISKILILWSEKP